MTFREKLADWLTGGKYSSAIDENSESMHSEAYWRYQHKLMSIAIESIASIPVTPSSNGQTRKAVRIAKEALKQ